MKKSIRLSYPFPSGNPVATIKLERDIVIKNESMPRLVVGQVYHAGNLPAQNHKTIVVKLQAGMDKYDGMKVVVEPSYSFNGPFSQYIRGVKSELGWERWNGYKDIDERHKDVMDNVTRALTAVHKLATKKDIDEVSKLVKLALVKLDKAKRKR